MFSKENLESTVKRISDNYKTEDFFNSNEGYQLPNRNKIIHIIMGIRDVIFPGYFSEEHHALDMSDYFLGHNMLNLYDNLNFQIKAALRQNKGHNTKEDTISDEADKICDVFFTKLPHIQEMLIKDVHAAFNGDPAAHSMEEIIFCYPGLLAIFIYRLAHELYKMKVPFIPRIMSEYAHSRTGIDINPGAVIGEYFFIDHGTGVVIGETTIIGNNVKIYQGVTLGALSTRSGQLLRDVKRHPTIKDNVTIYSNSSILGGETVIGKGVVIGGNAFITESVPDGSRVSVKTPEITITEKKCDNLFD